MNNQEAYIAYLKGKKSSFKTNYYIESLKEIKRIQEEKGGVKPKLLLHACCAVCACWPLEFLVEYFDVTVYFNNSNIYPETEYRRRLDELIRLIQDRWQDEVKIIVTSYQGEAFTKKLEPMKDEPEGWIRCFFCYTERMNEAFRYANSNGFDYFTTVMTFSRQKDSQKINEIGRKLETRYENTRYFYSDFKKGEGVKRSKEISEEHCLYRQDYCGCKFSYEESLEKHRGKES